MVAKSRYACKCNFNSPPFSLWEKAWSNLYLYLLFLYMQVALKIVKHCHEEGAGEIAQGVLLGLLVDKKLEITNCFPHPRAEEDDFDEG